ncbi:MAG: pyruvate kinase alpha/beta domain-containing protein [Anaerolineae bacterium]|nr:pyruvate kinase alpha/beta domain-containing protein [Anaerolineae bacterium]
MENSYSKILYFDTPGKVNTEATLHFARERALTLGIKQVVVASSHGYTAKQAKSIFAGTDIAIIAVTICAGYDDLGWTMTQEERAELHDLGITVLTSLHALGDDVSDSLSNAAPNRIVRETLYTFCQGMKVAVEVALMAADAGLLQMEHEIIAIAGTGDGADTALVIKPATARKFRQIEIREILAKPRYSR